ncbi:hypothetical protein JRO89_XSUnG0248600 [Xanthoceras sorbifolium]|uniref:Uncharacterized protein n=1 Tax=Xanthoceras sorbifolium TaxID=99658 RepID=A0ABQ8GXA0_9ROSI|nr:hypothetical protein JRO89_XSUnG0248600 [Xanthoceras sorbifolium]
MIGQPNRAVNSTSTFKKIRNQKDGEMDYLAMKTDDQVAAELINSDINDLKVAAKKLINHATKLGGLGLNCFSQMGCFLCCYLLVDIGSNKLENEHADFAISTLHIFQSSLSAVQLFKRRFWKMGCFHCSCTKTFLPTTISQVYAQLIVLLAGDAWIIDSASSGGSQFLCTQLEGQLGWCRNLSYYWLLPTSRAHPSIWWIQNSFTQSHGISNTLGIILVLVYPVWALVLHFL